MFHCYPSLPFLPYWRLPLPFLLFLLFLLFSSFSPFSPFSRYELCFIVIRPFPPILETSSPHSQSLHSIESRFHRYAYWTQNTFASSKGRHQNNKNFSIRALPELPNPPTPQFGQLYRLFPPSTRLVTIYE